MRTGKELWRRADTSPSGRAWPLRNGLVLLAGSEDLLALDPRDGEIRWHSERYRTSGRRPCVAVLAADGTVVWLVVGNRGSSASHHRTVVAYDLAADRELWTARLPTGYQESHLLPAALVVVTAEQGDPARLTAFAPKTGEKTWEHTYKSVEAGHFTTVADPPALVAADKNILRAYGLAEPRGKKSWETKIEDKYGQRPDFLGTHHFVQGRGLRQRQRLRGQSDPRPDGQGCLAHRGPSGSRSGEERGNSAHGGQS